MEQVRPAAHATTEQPVRSRSGRLRRAASVVGLVALLASAAVGGNLFGLRESIFGSVAPEPRPAAFSRVAGDSGGSSEETVLRSQPWWQSVQTLRGSGAASETITIDEGAIQWRATWTCERGYLLVEVSQREEPLIDEACPGSGAGSTVDTGPVKIDVTAGGPWKLEIEQQIDVPLVEPPLPEMTASGTDTVATGELYGIDRSGSGTATFYRTARGEHLLRLDEFFVTPNVDLEIRLSPLRRPQSTQEYLDAPSKFVAFLPITTGSLNFEVPRSVQPSNYRSLVIWCPPLRIAYAAISLESAK